MSPRTQKEERAILLAGGLGGPSCIAIYTPLRNAITLGAQDAVASAGSLYMRVWRSGPYTGWLSPTVFSSPQFLAMGPLYHVYDRTLGSSSLAVCATAVTETVISFGSQSRNAQMASNASCEPAARVPLQQPWDPRGRPAAFSCHVLRNAFAMSGFRVFSPLLKQASGDRVPIFATDFVASLGASVVSMPFNQLFNFLVTCPPTTAGGFSCCLDFLRRQYFTPSGGLSATMLRDLFMRCAYTAPLFASFSAIERVCLQLAAPPERVTRGASKVEIID